MLIHNKGDQDSLKTYRPICLSNTMAKLYIGLLAEVMEAYCEHFGILTAGQEGFRKNKGTARQGRLVLNAFTDARMAEGVMLVSSSMAHRLSTP